MKLEVKNDATNGDNVDSFFCFTDRYLGETWRCYMLWMLIFLLHCNASFLSFPFPFYSSLLMKKKSCFPSKMPPLELVVSGQDGSEWSVVTEAPLCAFSSSQTPLCCSLFFGKCVSLLALVCWAPFPPFFFTEGTKRQGNMERV